MSDDRWSDDLFPGRLYYRPCLSCGREHHVSHLVDNWCPQCRGEEPERETAQQRAARKRQLYAWTAEALRRIGRGDRAAWYEEHMP